jgi:hypothetical protein
MPPRLAALAAALIGLMGWLLWKGGDPRVALAIAPSVPGPAETVDRGIRTRPPRAATSQPPRHSAEVSAPVEAPPSTPPQAESPQVDFRALLGALRSDGTRWNATRAARELRGMVRDDSVGADARRTMLRREAEQLVYSDDAQQLAMVTELLILLALEEHADGVGLHPAIHARTLDWLAVAPDLESSMTGLDPASRDAIDLAITRIEWFDRDLVSIAADPADTRRYRAALALGVARRVHHADLIAAVLTPHLTDNSIQEDALESAFALCRLGPQVLPFLPQTGADPQQDYFLRALRLELAAPGQGRTLPPDGHYSWRAPNAAVGGWTPRRLGSHWD